MRGQICGLEDAFEEAAAEARDGLDAVVDEGDDVVEVRDGDFGNECGEGHGGHSGVVGGHPGDEESDVGACRV